MKPQNMRSLSLCTLVVVLSACSSEGDPPPATTTPNPTIPVASAPVDPSGVSPSGVSPSGSAPEQPVAPTTAENDGNLPTGPTATAPNVTPVDPTTSGSTATDGTDPTAPNVSPDATGNLDGTDPETTQDPQTTAPTAPDPADEPGCEEMAAPNEQITAFDNWDWVAADGSWGAAPDLTGGYFTYAGEGSLLEPFLSEDEPELRLIGNVQNYFGFGLWFGPCLDASQYLGISFTVTGELGDPLAVEEDPLLNGEIELQIQTSKNYVIDTENSKGECEGSWSEGTCKSNAATVTLDDSEPLVELLWEDFTGGVPEATVAANQLLGLQWQFNCEEVEGGPGCDMDITIDNVQFIVP